MGKKFSFLLFATRWIEGLFSSLSTKSKLIWVIISCFTSILVLLRFPHWYVPSFTPSIFAPLTTPVGNPILTIVYFRILDLLHAYTITRRQFSEGVPEKRTTRSACQLRGPVKGMARRKQPRGSHGGLAALPPIRRTGRKCTPASCARGRTLTIVACRRIVETRAIRIAESRGVPPVLNSYHFKITLHLRKVLPLSRTPTPQFSAGSTNRRASLLVY